MHDPSQVQSSSQPQTDEFDELEALLAEPVSKESTTMKTPDSSSDDEFDDLGDLLIDRSTYQGLPGTPTTAVEGKRYVCPEPGCTTEWFQQGLRTPPLCEQHGKVLVPAEDAG